MRSKSLSQSTTKLSTKSKQIPASNSKFKAPSEQRSRIMRAVRSENTLIEKKIRSVLDKIGTTYTVNDISLPGKPDIVLGDPKVALFVNGCFWHGHKCKRGARIPKTNSAYWIQKISRNTLRDRQVRKLLRELGWRTVTIWECQTNHELGLQKKLKNALR